MLIDRSLGRPKAAPEGRLKVPPRGGFEGGDGTEHPSRGLWRAARRQEPKPASQEERRAKDGETNAPRHECPDRPCVPRGPEPTAKAGTSAHAAAAREEVEGPAKPEAQRARAGAWRRGGRGPDATGGASPEHLLDCSSTPERCIDLAKASWPRHRASARPDRREGKRENRVVNAPRRVAQERDRTPM